MTGTFGMPPGVGIILATSGEKGIAGMCTLYNITAIKV